MDWKGRNNLVKTQSDQGLKGSEILPYLHINQLTCPSVMDVDRRHKIPTSEKRILLQQ